jgi:hypothetical protein
MDKFKERIEVGKAKRVPKNGSLYLGLFNVFTALRL